MKRVTGIMEVLLILVMVLGKSANATPVVFFDTADPLVEPGETISVSIFSNEPTSAIRMDRISNDAAGMASNLYLNPGYDWAAVFNEGTIVNSGGILMESVRGGLETPTSPVVSGVLYSFDYLVPAVSLGTIITIFADPSSGAINEVDVVGMIDNVMPESLSLTIVPEPGTIFLLGIGALLLATRNR